MCIGGRTEGGAQRHVFPPIFLNRLCLTDYVHSLIYYTVGRVQVHETEIRANDRTTLQLFWTDVGIFNSCLAGPDSRQGSVPRD